jgi:serine/threonine protein kinase
LVLDNSEYAIKVIRKDKGYTPEVATKLVEMEVNTMLKLGSHPCLVNLVSANKAICCYKKVDSVLKDGVNGETKNYVAVREEVNYIILEKCMNGSLSKYVKNTGPMEELVTRFFFTQLCSAVHFMHTEEFVHLDIKLDNILLDEWFNLKLADLGIALCAKGTSGYLAHRRGTNRYMAPEVDKASTKAPYNAFKADLYSLGVVLHLMLFGTYPDSNQDEEKSTGDCHSDEEMTDDQVSDLQGMDEKLSSTVSEECMDLLNSLLNLTATKRPSMEQVMNHAWMVQEFPENI